MSNQEQAMEQSAEQNTEALLDAELADAGTGSTASDELTALLEKLAQAEPYIRTARRKKLAGDAMHLIALPSKNAG